MVSSGWVLSGKGTKGTVSSGDSAYETIVRNSASLYVDQGGYVESTHVFNSAAFSNGGSASATFLSGGTMMLFSGGIAEEVMVLRGARLTVSSGGVATGVTVAASGNVNATVKGGDSATRIEGTNDLGSFYLSDGVASNFILNSTGNLMVSSGGTALDTVVNARGKLTVSGGGVATGIVQSKAGELNTHIIGGDSQTRVAGTNDSGTFLLSDGVASGFILYENAAQYVSSGGTALHTLVSSTWAHQYVSSGGLASATSVCNKGSMTVRGGGSARDTLVYSGGLMFAEGGHISETTVLGELRVSSGTSGEEESGGKIAIFENLAVLSGGIMKVTQNAEFGGSITLNGTNTLTAPITSQDHFSPANRYQGS